MSGNGPRPLSEARRRAADRAFQNYVFDSLTVAETDGWESTEPGFRYSRTVYFENPAGGDSVKGRFTVVFDGYDSTCVREAYAMVEGNEIGSSAAYIATPLVP